MKGKIFAIEVEFGDYLIREDWLDAAQKARGKFPDKIFVFFCIGYPVVYKFRKVKFPFQVIFSIPKSKLNTSRIFFSILFAI